MRPLNLPRLPRLARFGGLELAARRVLDGLGAGRHRSPSLGPASEFHDHRAYQPGDDLRQVDWRLAARTDHLLVRRQREDRELPLVLVVDSSASMAWGEPAKLDTARLLAAVLGLMACDQGDRVRVFAGAGNSLSASPAWAGLAGAGPLCAHLSSLTGQGAGDAAALLTAVGARLERRALVVLCADLLQSPGEIAQAAGRLTARGHEVVVIQVLHADELALPADWGACVLRDPEGAVADLAADCVEAKAGYDAAMASQREQLARGLAAARCELLLCRCQDDPAQILGAWLHRRQRC